MSNENRQGPLTGDQVERRISEFAKQRYPQPAHLHLGKEAHDCGIDRARYEEILLQLHADDLVRLMRFQPTLGRESST